MTLHEHHYADAIIFQLRFILTVTLQRHYSNTIIDLLL